MKENKSYEHLYSVPCNDFGAVVRCTGYQFDDMLLSWIRNHPWNCGCQRLRYSFKITFKEWQEVIDEINYL
jgi:hypothetical protein